MQNTEGIFRAPENTDTSSTHRQMKKKKKDYIQHSFYKNLETAQSDCDTCQCVELYGSQKIVVLSSFLQSNRH